VVELEGGEFRVDEDVAGEGWDFGHDGHEFGVWEGHHSVVGGNAGRWSW